MRRRGNGMETVHDGADHWSVARGGGSPRAGPDGRYDLPRDGVHGAELVSLAARARRSEARPGQAAEGSRTRERSSEEGGVGADAGQADPEGSSRGKMLSPSRIILAGDEAPLQAS